MTLTRMLGNAINALGEKIGSQEEGSAGRRRVVTDTSTFSGWTINEDHS